MSRDPRVHPRRAPGRHRAREFTAGAQTDVVPLTAQDVAAVADSVVVDALHRGTWSDGTPVEHLEHLAAAWSASVRAHGPAAEPMTYQAPPPVFPPVPVTPTPAAPRALSPLRPAPGWAPRHDPRSLAYGVRGRLIGSVAVQDHLWPAAPVLSQGTEGSCVGMAVATAANVAELVAVQHPTDVRADGTPVLLTEADAHRLYARAQQLDDVPGADYAGTSVLAGMLAGREAGYWDEFLWAFGTRDVAQAVLQVGPVLIGVPWLSGMATPGPAGLLEVAGDDVGGHCLTVLGMRRERAGRPGPWFVLQNSYGPGWGDSGLGYLHHRDLARLLAGQGEAAVPVPTS